jgi:hypothetical protein
MLRIQRQKFTKVSNIVYKESLFIRIIQSNKNIEDNLYDKRTEVY